MLVTGAGGFVGTHLARRLEARGARVDRFGRNDSPAELTEGYAFVFHLAAETRPDASDQQYHQSNVRLTDQLLKRIPTASLSRFVHFGTCGEYGRLPPPIREDAACRPADPYGASKLAGTRAVLGSGVPFTVVRPFLTFGPGQSGARLLPSLFAAAAGTGPVDLSPGGQTRDVIFVEDVVDAALRLAMLPAAEAEIVNVGSGTARTVREIATTVFRMAGADEGRLRFGERDYREGEPMDFYADVTKLKRLLDDWRPTPFPDAVQRTLAAS